MAAVLDVKVSTRPGEVDRRDATKFTTRVTAVGYVRRMGEVDRRCVLKNATAASTRIAPPAAFRRLSPHD